MISNGAKLIMYVSEIFNRKLTRNLTKESAYAIG